MSHSSTFSDDPSVVLMQGLPSRSSEDDVYRILEELTEITPDYVTAIKVHQNKRSALVKLKDTDGNICSNLDVLLGLVACQNLLIKYVHFVKQMHINEKDRQP